MCAPARVCIQHIFVHVHGCFLGGGLVCGGKGLWRLLFVIIRIIMVISTAPYLLKIVQPKARTKAIQTTSQTHTHMHRHTDHHFRITCHQNTHTKKLKIKPLDLHLHSLSLSPPTRSHTGAGHMQSNRRKSRVSTWTHREVLRVWFVHWAE